MPGSFLLCRSNLHKHVTYPSLPSSVERSESPSLHRCTVVHTMRSSEFEWDPKKSAANFRKHGIRFAEAATAFSDESAITNADPDSNGELRFVALAQDARVVCS